MNHPASPAPPDGPDDDLPATGRTTTSKPGPGADQSEPAPDGGQSEPAEDSGQSEPGRNSGQSDQELPREADPDPIPDGYIPDGYEPL